MNYLEFPEGCKFRKGKTPFTELKNRISLKLNSAKTII
jgi:hypothetical protein